MMAAPVPVSYTHLARMPHEEEQPEEESTEEAGESAVPDADEAPAGAPKAEEPSQPET